MTTPDIDNPYKRLAEVKEQLRKAEILVAELQSQNAILGKALQGSSTLQGNNADGYLRIPFEIIIRPSRN